MTQSSRAGQNGSLRTLRRLAQKNSGRELCEFCSLPLAASHRHLLELGTRKIICVCDPCALRFENVVGRWKLIPRDARRLPDFQMSDAAWESLALPINLAFFFYSTPANKLVAMYPSPAGAMESLLTLESWQSLATENPNLRSLERDVEALLVNRLSTPAQCYFAPIDVCFELVGLIRLHWRGLSGGETVWREVESFFQKLKESASSYIPAIQEAAHA
jgi:Family of unknown function (DUF5947)